MDFINFSSVTKLFNSNTWQNYYSSFLGEKDRKTPYYKGGGCRQNIKNIILIIIFILILLCIFK